MSVDMRYLGILGFVFPTLSDPCDYPDIDDVRYPVSYGNGEFVGTLVVPRAPGVTTVLVHSPADILRTALIALGLGADPPGSPWPIHASSEPDIPDNSITVYDTLGIDDGRAMPTGQLQQHQGVQVRVRSKDHVSGWRKAEAIRSTMAEGIYDRGVLIDSSAYLLHSVNNISNVLALGKEIPTSKRSIFVVNAIVSVKQVA